MTIIAHAAIHFGLLAAAKFMKFMVWSVFAGAVRRPAARKWTKRTA